MESLNPTQALVLALKFGLERGNSVGHSSRAFLKEPENKLTAVVGQWLVLRELGQNPEILLKNVKSPYRQAILRILDRGLLGETIYPALVLAETEINESVTAEIDAFLSLLPLKMLIPLLLFQFPAFLLLLFGPLLNEILHRL
jgi:hypothetical protein